MNEQLQQKLEELLLLAKSQGVSIVGVVDIPGAEECHIFKNIEADCKAGTRNLDSVLMSQHCTQGQKNCQSCHLSKSGISDDGLALLFTELNANEPA
ncbi:MULTISPECIES: hypothetical protein [Vibrio]|uniref:hypothetical protein n=1 Tax=Vibrio TaxID=662 RepID=UPI001F485C40|nr:MULTISPECIES: hypothetical protein [Vibrio]USD58768.1 hypothetical protein J4N45_09505 [Vibrio sp. SCSIO 43140]